MRVYREDHCTIALSLDGLLITIVGPSWVLGDLRLSSSGEVSCRGVGISFHTKNKSILSLSLSLLEKSREDHPIAFSAKYANVGPTFTFQVSLYE